MLKHHLISGFVSAVIAAIFVVSGGYFVYNHAPRETVRVVATGRGAWPGLSGEQRDEMAIGLHNVPAGHLNSLQLLVLCNDGSCTELAHDIDDAAEDAGVDSALDRSFTPLGYGVGIIESEEVHVQSDAVAALLGSVLGLKVDRRSQADTAHHVIIAIGKRPRDYAGK